VFFMAVAAEELSSHLPVMEGVQVVLTDMVVA
jgi:hypothetical protein